MIRMCDLSAQLYCNSNKCNDQVGPVIFMVPEGLSHAADKVCIHPTPMLID